MDARASAFKELSRDKITRRCRMVRVRIARHEIAQGPLFSFKELRKEIIAGGTFTWKLFHFRTVL